MQLHAATKAGLLFGLGLGVLLIQAAQKGSRRLLAMPACFAARSHRLGPCQRCSWHCRARLAAVPLGAPMDAAQVPSPAQPLYLTQCLEHHLR